MQELVNIEGRIIRGIIENPDQDKIVVLVHGFTGDLDGPDGAYIRLSEQLQERGFSICRFSMRGTPPSEGDFREMTLDSETADLNEVVSYLRDLGYGRISLIGESMGGSVVANANLEGVEKIVFWYPTFDFSHDSFIDYLSEERKLELRAKGYLDLYEGFKLGRNFIEDIPKIKLWDKLPSVDVPVLFVHGDQDTDVPLWQSEKGVELIGGNSSLIVIEGVDHCFRGEGINKQDETIQLSVDFLSNDDSYNT